MGILLLNAPAEWMVKHESTKNSMKLPHRALHAMVSAGIVSRTAAETLGAILWPSQRQAARRDNEMRTHQEEFRPTHYTQKHRLSSFATGGAGTSGTCRLHRFHAVVASGITAQH